MSHDRYAEWDGAYVLGALSPADRHEYEEHLAGCEECGRSVQDLAGIPGLLARATDAGVGAGRGVPRQRPPAGTPQAAPAGGPVPLPDTLLPALLDHVTSHRRGRVRRLSAWAAAAAVAATVLLVTTVAGPGERDSAPAAGPGPQVVATVGAADGLAFAPVADSASYAARAVLVDESDGALVLLRCEALSRTSYGAGRGGIHKSAEVPDLELWSVGAGGERELTRWSPKPVGQVVQAAATAPVPVAGLGTLEVRSAGQTLLRLRVSTR